MAAPSTSAVISILPTMNAFGGRQAKPVGRPLGEAGPIPIEESGTAIGGNDVSPQHLAAEVVARKSALRPGFWRQRDTSLRHPAQERAGRDKRVLAPNGSEQDGERNFE